MNDYFDLRQICHVNTNEEGDRFVGIRVESNKVSVSFPIGYCLSENEKGLREDIRHLISLLAIFDDHEGTMHRNDSMLDMKVARFPVHAYLNLLDMFVESNGTYFRESERKVKKSSSGKINFKSTLKHQKGLIVNDNLVFSVFDVENRTPLNNQLITRIHKYCVYTAFQSLGWLYPIKQIPNPGIKLNKKVFLHELSQKYSQTYNEQNKRLFSSMIAVIDSLDKDESDGSFRFGTESFEYVWEKMIDKCFGVENKEDYFPNAVWVERKGATIPTSALMPDTIMIRKNRNETDKVYILDAKYYRYGVTHKLEHLPDSSSINKQITYGEYAERKFNLSNGSLYNAFLMPYNMKNNSFCSDCIYVNVAESYGLWRHNLKSYERIQGILVDVRYLILNYLGNHMREQENLAKAIEEYL